MSLVICWDFDETLVNGHFHNQLFYMGVQPKGEQPQHAVELIKRFGLKNPEKVRDSIRLALNNGHKVAVTSFTLYKGIVGPTLRAIGLNEEEIAQIYIRGEFPSDGPSTLNGKREHIQDVMKHFNITDEAKVILVDDSERNCAAARKDGHHAIQAYKSPVNSSQSGYVYHPEHDRYIDELNELIQRLQLSTNSTTTTTGTSRPTHTEGTLNDTNLNVSASSSANSNAFGQQLERLRRMRALFKRSAAQHAVSRDSTDNVSTSQTSSLLFQDNRRAQSEDLQEEKKIEPSSDFQFDNVGVKRKLEIEAGKKRKKDKSPVRKHSRTSIE